MTTALRGYWRWQNDYLVMFMGYIASIRKAVIGIAGLGLLSSSVYSKDIVPIDPLVLNNPVYASKVKETKERFFVTQTDLSSKKPNGFTFTTGDHDINSEGKLLGGTRYHLECMAGKPVQEVIRIWRINGANIDYSLLENSVFYAKVDNSIDHIEKGMNNLPAYLRLWTWRLSDADRHYFNEADKELPKARARFRDELKMKLKDGYGGRNCLEDLVRLGKSRK